VKYYQEKTLISVADWEAVPWVRKIELDYPGGVIVSIPWWCPVKRKVREYIDEWAPVLQLRCVVYRPCWW
jgi:hypothetical protein